MDAEECKKLSQHREATRALLHKRKRSQIGGVFVGKPVSVTPLGAPDSGKSGDSITANAISRLCAIKNEEHQLRAGIANVFWFDLQDDYSWNLALEPGEVHPVSSWQGVMVSGALPIRGGCLPRQAD
jgi:hypothetical protein